VRVRIVASGIAIAALAGVAVPVALSNSASAVPSPTAPPMITKCMPATATMGKNVVIHGTGLANATKVTIGGKVVTPLTDTARAIKAQVPTGINAASNVKVVTANGSFTATCTFQRPPKK
jgi:hypothetical protein